MDSPQSKHSLQSVLTWAEQLFNDNDLYYGHGTDNAWDEAVFIASHCLEKAELTEDDLPYELTDTEYDQFKSLCERRVSEKIPAAYLVGYMYFAGLPFKVNSDVLVPRSPIAELIARDFQPWVQDIQECTRALDLCCGSGCIGLAIAHYNQQLTVDIADISDKAIAVSEANREALDLKARVNIVHSDLFEALDGPYDLIVSNPPYVSEGSWSELPEEFMHEPKLGFVADDNGLDIVDRILKQAANYLNDNGVLIVEVGELMPVVMDAYPELPLMWLDFESGGEGVFMITKEDLIEWGVE